MKIPKLCKQKCKSGDRAFVIINGARYYCGRYGSLEAQEQYLVESEKAYFSERVRFPIFGADTWSPQGRKIFHCRGHKTIHRGHRTASRSHKTPNRRQKTVKSRRRMGKYPTSQQA